jgi:hypothetical protein
MDQVIGPNGILKNKTRLLVTHRASVLTNVHQIIVLKDGAISESGTFEELIANKGDFAEFVAEYILQQTDSEDVNEEEMEVIDELREKVKPFIERQMSVRSGHESDIRRQFSVRSTSVTSSKGKESKEDKSEAKGKGQKRKGGKLIEAETSETGSVKFEVYTNYFQMIGWHLIGLVILFYVAANGATIGSGLWLSEWSNDALDPQKANDTHLRDMRLGVYAGIGLSETLFILSSHLLLSLSCIRAAKLLHNRMLFRILRAPMAFFGINSLTFVFNKILMRIHSQTQHQSDEY